MRRKFFFSSTFSLFQLRTVTMDRNIEEKIDNLFFVRHLNFPEQEVVGRFLFPHG